MGEYICDTILDYCDPDQTKALVVLVEYKQSLIRRFYASSRGNVTYIINPITKMTNIYIYILAPPI